MIKRLNDFYKNLVMVGHRPTIRVMKIALFVLILSFPAVAEDETARAARGVQQQVVVAKSSPPVEGSAKRGVVLENSARAMPAKQSRSAVRTTSAPVSQTTERARSVQSRGVATTSNREQNNSALTPRSAVRTRAGETRRTTTAAGGRAVSARTGDYTTTNFDNRNVSGRVATRGRAADDTAEVASENTGSVQLEQTASVASCSERYAECMDQFCNVVDERQQRCSCSANLQNYKDAETKLKNANQELNAVAQNIRYVGLSGEEIMTLFTETEAENAMRRTNDNSLNRGLLEEIEDMIFGATNDLGETNNDNSGDFFDINLEDAEFNLESMFGSNDKGFATLRGKKLRDSAAKKCENIIRECSKDNVPAEQITGNYDLQIDKDCTTFENTLVRMNDSVSSNVRAANTMLQKARLAVLQNQNEYDFRGCVAALDTCILEDSSCGKNYIRCLDPTRNYLDDAGKIIMGGRLPDIIKMFDDVLDGGAANLENEVMVSLNKNKIGEPDKSGMCSDVMKSCRRLTFVGGEYNQENEVLKAFLTKAATQMKTAAQKVVSDYASSCLTDVAACYQNQQTQISAWTSGYNGIDVNNIKNVMLGACYSVSITCASSVFQNDSSANGCPADNDSRCIENLSKLFYNSMLCKTHEIYKADEGCVCMPGYVKPINSGYCRACTEADLQTGGICANQAATAASAAAGG